MKLVSALITLTTVVGATATSSTGNARTVKGVESSRKLSGYGDSGYGYNYGNYGYENYGSSGGGGSHHSSSSPHKPSPPKPKAKETKKPKAAPKPKKPSSHHSSGGSSNWGGYDSGYGYGYDESSSNGYSSVGYAAVGVLTIAGAVLAKKRCSSQEPAIDASDILEGDYEKSGDATVDDAVEERSIVEMTSERSVTIDDDDDDDDNKSTTAASIV